MPEDNGTFPFQIKSIILDLCRLLVEGTDFLSVLSQPGIDGKRTHFNNALGVADVSEMMGGGGIGWSEINWLLLFSLHIYVSRIDYLCETTSCINETLASNNPLDVRYWESRQLVHALSLRFYRRWRVTESDWIEDTSCYSLILWLIGKGMKERWGYDSNIIDNLMQKIRWKLHHSKGNFPEAWINFIVNIAVVKYWESLAMDWWRWRKVCSFSLHSKRRPTISMKLLSSPRRIR